MPGQPQPHPRSPDSGCEGSIPRSEPVARAVIAAATSVPWSMDRRAAARRRGRRGRRLVAQLGQEDRPASDQAGPGAQDPSGSLEHRFRGRARPRRRSPPASIARAAAAGWCVPGRRRSRQASPARGKRCLFLALGRFARLIGRKVRPRAARSRAPSPARVSPAPAPRPAAIHDAREVRLVFRLGLFPIGGGEQRAIEQQQRVAILRQQLGERRPAP